jgi:hypothetical protein
MIAPLPTYEIRFGHLRTDGGERVVGEAIGYEATIAAVRYLLTSGEEEGELTTHYADAPDNARELETFYLLDGMVAAITTAGLRRTLR